MASENKALQGEVRDLLNYLIDKDKKKKKHEMFRQFNNSLWGCSFFDPRLILGRHVHHSPCALDVWVGFYPAVDFVLF